MIALFLVMMMNVACAFDPAQVGLNLSQPLGVYRPIGDAEFPWSKGGPVTYSNAILDDRSEGVTELDAIVGAIAARAMQRLEQNIKGKQKAVGDFEELNALFEGTIIKLPDAEFEVDVPWPFTHVDIKITQLQMSNLHIDDLIVSHARVNDGTLDLTIKLVNLDVDVSANWWYDFGFTGSGSVVGSLDDNDMTVIIRFESQNFNTHAPHASSVQSCNANLDITSIHFSGGISGSILNLFKSSVMSLIEDEVSTLACTELGTLGSTAVSDGLRSVSDLLDPYLVARPATDPLLPERSLQPPVDVELLSFQNPESTFGVLAKDAFDSVASSMSKVDESTGELAINAFVRDNVLDESGNVELALADLDMLNGGTLYTGHDMLTETTIAATAVRISGLDTFTTFEPLVAIGHWTLSNRLAIRRIGVEIDLTIDMKPSTHSSSVIVNPSSPHQIEHVTIRTALENLDMTAAVLLALDQNKIDSTQLGSLLHSKQIAPCVLATVFNASFTQLVATVGDIEPPTLTGFLSVGIDRVVNDLATTVFEMYEGAALRALPNILDTTLRHSLNDILNGYFEDPANVACVVPDVSAIEATYGPAVDFEKLFYDTSATVTEKPYGDVLAMAKSLLDDNLINADPTTGKPRINTVVVGPLTESQSNISGTLAFPGEMFAVKPEGVNFGPLTSIEISASDARVENLDTFATPFHVLKPTSAQVLENRLTIGKAPRPLSAAARLVVALSGENIAVHNDFNIVASIEDVSALLSAMVRVQTKSFLSLPVGSMLNTQCWLATLHEESVDPSARAAEIVDFVVEFLKIGMRIDCNDCTSPMLVQIDALLQTQEGQDEVARLAMLLLNYTSDTLRSDELRDRVAHMISESPRRCADPTFEGTDFVSSAAFVSATTGTPKLDFIVSAGIVAVSFLALICVCVCCIRSHRSIVVEWNLEAKRTVAAVRAAEQKREKRELAKHSRPMFLSPHIPLLVRAIMPLVIVGNIALFASGHISLGASVDIDINVIGEAVKIEKFFEFSMAKSTFDMWNAGAKELAVLLVIFSGLWPYAKQFTVLVLWFAPPSWITPPTRGSVFVWLDSLGKWSMVDIFVLVVALVSFRLTIYSPENPLVPSGLDLYSVALKVIPLWGLYANLIAQLVSQLSSHAIIYYHRNVDAAARQKSKIAQYEPSGGPSGRGGSSTNIVSWSSYTGLEYDLACMRDGTTKREIANILATKTSLAAHAFEVRMPHVAIVRVRHRVTWALVTAGAIFVPLLVLAGSFLPSLRLEVWGVVGAALDLGRENSHIRDFSLEDIINLILSQAQESENWQGYVGLTGLCVVFIVCSVVAPVVESWILVVVWIRPMTLKGLKRMLVLLECTAAWQYMEVFLIAITVASLQLGQISGFMVNTYCEDLGDTFATLVQMGFLDARDGQCFYVHASILYSAYILLAAAGLLALLSQLVIHLANAAIEDRERRFRAMRTRCGMSTSTLAEEEAVWDLPPLREATMRGILSHASPRLLVTNYSLPRELQSPFHRADLEKGVSRKVRGRTASSLRNDWIKLARKGQGGDIKYFNEFSGVLQREKPKRAHAFVEMMNAVSPVSPAEQGGISALLPALNVRTIRRRVSTLVAASSVNDGGVSHKPRIRPPPTPPKKKRAAPPVPKPLSALKPKKKKAAPPVPTPLSALKKTTTRKKKTAPPVPPPLAHLRDREPSVDL